MALSDSPPSGSRSSDSSSSRSGSTQGSSSRSRHVPWQRDYKAVLTETDTNRLFKLVEVAEASILTRRASLEGSADHHDERRAIEEALANLLVVKKERLKFL